MKTRIEIKNVPIELRKELRTFCIEKDWEYVDFVSKALPLMKKLSTD